MLSVILETILEIVGHAGILAASAEDILRILGGNAVECLRLRGIFYQGAEYIALILDTERVIMLLTFPVSTILCIAHLPC